MVQSTSSRLDYDSDITLYGVTICGETCAMCVPDGHERRGRIGEIERPTFTFAERVLTQVGIALRQVRGPVADRD